MAKKNQEITLAQAAELESLVEYQTGSIVSRQLVHQKTGSVTLFAFAAGQSLSEHTAPFDAMVYIVSGQAQIIIDGLPHTLKAGQMIIMPANHPHAVQAAVKFKMLLIMIRS